MKFEVSINTKTIKLYEAIEFNTLCKLVESLKTIFDVDGFTIEFHLENKLTISTPNIYEPIINPNYTIVHPSIKNPLDPPFIVTCSSISKNG